MDKFMELALEKDRMVINMNQVKEVEAALQIQFAYNYAPESLKRPSADEIAESMTLNYIIRLTVHGSGLYWQN